MTTANDDEATLYADVLRRLELAREQVRSLPTSVEVKQALQARVNRLAERAKSDLTRASRRVDRLLEEVASGTARMVDEADEAEDIDEAVASRQASHEPGQEDSTNRSRSRR